MIPRPAALLAALLAAAPPALAGAPPEAGAKPAKEAADAGSALAAAAELLKAKVAALPRREAGVPAGPEEVRARLRLAFSALALDGTAEAHAALEPLGRCRGKRELQRLALMGLASWSASISKDRAAGFFEELLRLTDSGRRLGLRCFKLVDGVRAYGVYDERAARTARPGESILAYCEVLNFQCNKLDSGGHLTALDVDLAFETEIARLDRRGQPATERRVVGTLRDFSRVRHRTRSPLRDLHLVVRFNVPRDLEPGRDYDLRITVRDQGNAPATPPEESGKTQAGGGKRERQAAAAASALLRFRVSR